MSPELSLLVDCLTWNWSLETLLNDLQLKVGVNTCVFSVLHKLTN